MTEEEKGQIALEHCDQGDLLTLVSKKDGLSETIARYFFK